MKTLVRDTVVTILMALLIFVGLRATVEQYVIEQTSMMPNLVEGQRIFIIKTTYFFHSPNRGDIIVFYSPDTTDKNPLIKRVIGLPGERVEIKSGSVYINDSPINEPYLKEFPEYKFAEYTIPEQHYFVLGDNRNSSRDSHYGWTVDSEDIIGKAWVSIWPPDKWGLAPNYVYARALE